MAYTFITNSVQAGPGPSYFKSNYTITISASGIQLRRWVSVPSGSGWGGTGLYVYWKGGTSKTYKLYGEVDVFEDTDTYNWLSTGTTYNLGDYDADSGANFSTKATSRSGTHVAIPKGTYRFSKITFDANGGTLATNTGWLGTATGSNFIYVLKGSDMFSGIGCVPTRTNYTFKGWYTAKSGGTQVFNSSGNCIKGTSYWDSSSKWAYDGGTVTLYAQWTGKASTVTFNANGGATPTASKTVNYGSTYGTLPTPTRVGHSFVGWFTAASGGTQVTSSTTVSITSEQTLYAHWTVNSYTVTFDANGGSVGAGSQSATYGTTLSSLQIPKRSGFEFKRWYARFDGSNFLNLGRAYMFSDKISVHFDAYMEDWSKCTSQRLISCIETGGWNIESQNDCIFFSAYDSGVGYNSAASSKRWDELSSGWHTFDFVFDGSKAYGYLDGELIATSSAFSSGKIGYNATNSLMVGAEPASDPTTPFGSYFTGRISNLAIRNTGSLITDAQNCFMSPAQSMNMYAEWERSSTTSVNVGGSFAPSIPYVCIDGEFKMGYAHVYDAESGEWKIGITN